MAPIDYRRVFEATPTPCLLLSARFEIIAASTAYLASVQRERDELVGKSIFVAFPDNPDDPLADGSRNLRHSLESVLASHKIDTMAVQKYDIPCTLPDGLPGYEVRYWSPVNSPVLGDDGELLYILHRATDVTTFMAQQAHTPQQTQMTAQLRVCLRESLPSQLRGLPRVLVIARDAAAQAYLHKHLVERYDVACVDDGAQAVAVIARFRPDTILSAATMPQMTGPQMLRMLKNRPDTAGIPCLFLTAQADDALRLNLLEEGAHDYLVEPFAPQELHLRLAHAVTTYRVRQVMQEALDTSAQDLEDLAQKLAAQSRRAQALYHVTQEALTARSQFITVAAHELRTPVTALKLHITRLQRRVDALQIRQLGDPCEKIVHQSDRLTVLINELLDAAALEQGSMTLQLREVDLRAVVEDVCRDAASVASGCTVPPIHVHAEAPVQGRWDALRLQQVVTSLLSNAIKYGEGQPVRITLASRGSDAILEVQDHGPGIAPKDQQRIFRRFERAVSFRNISGLGMGLYIAQQTLHAMGGSIELVSNLGEGATFTARLPLAGPSPP